LLEYRRYDAITGHLAAIPGDSLPTDRVCVTLLREPVDRAISQFSFMRTIHTSGLRREPRAETVDAWVASMEESDGDTLNGHVEALWPLGWSVQERPSTPQRVEAAIEALRRFDIVGLQDQLLESVAVLDYWMGWPASAALPVDNRTPDRPAVTDLAPRTRARLSDLLAPDIELFEYARQRFAKQRLSVLIHATAEHSKTQSANVAPVQSELLSETLAERADDGARFPGESGTGEIVVSGVTVTGEVSGREFVQTGEWVTIAIEMDSRIDELNLTAGFAIRDHNAGLMFGTNTLLLGRSISVTPGRYSVSFRFPNALGMGKYSVTVALHRGASHLDGCFHWQVAAATFEVADSIAKEFEGRVQLHVDADVVPLDSGSVVACRDVDRLSNSPLQIGRRNAALRDFRAHLSAIRETDQIRAGAEGLMELTIGNRSDEVWGAFGRRPVHVAHRWIASDGSVLMYDGLRTPFPHDVKPGQDVRLPCLFRAPDVTGEACLVWTLVQEEVAWFDERNRDSRLIQVVRVA
jgi:hypothetical protein